MARKGLRRAFVAFHLTLGIVIFIESVLAVIHSLHSQTASHLTSILPWFAAVEAISAAMLLIPQTLKIGGAILLLIFIAAIVVHGPADGLPLFVYAAAVVFVMAHGSEYRAIRD